MLQIGLHTAARSSLKYLKLVTLFGIILAVYLFLRKKTTLSNSNDIYSILQQSGLNDTLCKYALAQSAHETAGFTSSIFKNNLNAFGMKYAGQVNALGEKSGHAYYKDVNSSVADFVAWYTRKRSSILSLPLVITSLDSYVRFLKNNKYFEADESEYLNGCKYYYDLYFG